MSLIVNFLDHCSFCLRELRATGGEDECGSNLTVGGAFTRNTRQTSESFRKNLGKFSRNDTNDKITTVRKFEISSSQNSSSLSSETMGKLWPFIVINGSGRSLNLPAFTFMTGTGIEDGVKKCSEIPPMCVSCGEKIEELTRLIKELMGKAEEIQFIIGQSSKFGRHNERYRRLSENLEDQEKDVRKSTLEFLDYLRCGEWIRKVGDKEEETDNKEIERDGDSDVDLQSLEYEVKTEVDHDQVTENISDETNRPVIAIDNNKMYYDMFVNLKSHSDSPQYLQSPVGVTPKRQRKSAKPKHTIRRRNSRIPIETVKKQLCDFCSTLVPLPQMEDHMKAHVGDYLCKCPNPKCRKVFSCRSILEQVHNILKSGTKCRKFVAYSPAERGLKKKCDTCEFETFSRAKFRSHLQREHETSANPFQCPVASCAKRFSVRQSVDIHIVSHTRVVVSNGKGRLLPASCQICSVCKSPLKLDQMEEHLKDKHSAVDIIHCKYCDYLFPSHQDLIDHLFVHVKQGKVVTCDLCGEEDRGKYIRHVKLREHYFAVHKVGTKLPCEVCKKTFWLSDHLRSHMRFNHTNKSNEDRKKELFKCDICIGDVVQFAREDALRTHKIKVHGAEPFACNICAKTFTARKSLIAHEREHEGIKQEFRCDIEGCGKVFKQKTGLTMHQASIEHVGKTKNAICDICGKGFNTTAGLTAHRKNVHFGKRLIICDECGESFVYQKVLRRHKLIHTGERPFECPICQQKFRQQTAMIIHRRSHEEKGDNFRPTGPMKHIRKRKL